MADVIGQRAGRVVRHVRVPAEVVCARLQAWFAEDMAALHGMLADGYEDAVTSDTSALTGAPATTLDQFAADFCARVAPFTVPGRQSGARWIRTSAAAFPRSCRAR